MYFQCDPIVLRGIPMDRRTQVGFYGTPLQVLNQQGRIGVEFSLGYCRRNFWLRKTKKYDGLGQDHCKVNSSIPFLSDWVDEESDVDEQNVHPRSAD